MPAYINEGPLAAQAAPAPLTTATSPQGLINAVQRAIGRKTKFGAKDAQRAFEASLLREAAARTGDDPEIIVAVEACVRDLIQAPAPLTPAKKEQRVAALRHAIAILSQELDPTPLERAIAEATQ